MKIETKYSLGQEVWMMWQNRAICRKIDNIYISKSVDEQYEAYQLECIKEDDEKYLGVDFELDELFPTKEELLKSL